MSGRPIPAALKLIDSLKRLARIQAEGVQQLDRLMRHDASERQVKQLDRLKSRLKPRSAMIDRIERAVRRAARERERLLGK